MEQGIQIGELANRFDLNPKTIRYYEQIGLLPEPERSLSGYRRYNDAAVERLGFIRRARVLGLSLEEIGEILSLKARDLCPCGHVLDIIDAKITAIDRRIADLQALRSDLGTLRGAWIAETERLQKAPSEQGCVCQIIEQTIEMVAPPPSVEVFEPKRRHAPATP